MRFQERIENTVGNLIGQLVGMPHADGLAGKQKLAACHWLLLVRKTAKLLPGIAPDERVPS